MPTPTATLTAADHALDQLLARALDGRPVKHRVWAMLRSEDSSNRAEPLLVTVQIVAEDGQLLWHPVRGHTIGADRREVDLETLRGDRIWWGPFVRRFARSRVRVELERQQLADREHGQGDEVERVLAGFERYEQAVLAAAVNGEKSIRVLATFAPPRGYGEA